MLRKLLLVFIALNVLVVAVLAIVFPSKNEHVFTEDSHGPRIENYHERHWELLPPEEWGMNLFTFGMCWGCGPTGSRGEGVRRFGFIGIVEKQGWQTTEKKRGRQSTER